MQRRSWYGVTGRGRAVVALLFLFLAVPVCAAVERHALVIGNAAYREQGVLANTINDARDVAAKLKGLGFEVTKVENASRRELTGAVNEFIKEMQGTDGVALFYYSGHGLQLNGENYLLPVDARIGDALDVPYEGVPVNRMLAGLGGRGDKAANLVILDACRNNPYKTTDARAIGDKGLARVNAPSGTLILYAAKPGETASDNPGGRNGLFTQHLLEVIDDPGVEVEDAFKRAAEKVYVASNRRQDPWMEGRIRGRLYFVPAPPGAPGAVPIPPGAPVVPGPGFSPEVVFWQSVERNPSRAGYEAYLRQWPKGRFAALARLRLEGAPGGLERRLAACRAHLQANRLTTPAGRNALECYETVLAEDAGNAEALKGLEAITGRYLGWAESNIARGQLAKAETYLERAKRVSPEDPRVVALGERLVSAREDAAAAVPSPAPAPAASEAAVPSRHPELEPEMVRIRGGRFEMGSPSYEAGRDEDEGVHGVTVEAFRLAKREVTVGAYRRFVAATGYRTDAERDAGGNDGCFAEKDGQFGYQGWASWRDPGYRQGDDHPVVCVSWNDALAYIEWLNRETGGGYRLPTEAEWEYGARAGTLTARYWGNDADAACGYANVADRAAKRRYSDWTVHDCDDGVIHTAPVGRYRANAWGLYDMLGNVWEWTCSVYDEGYGGGERRCAGQSDEGRRALRGGSWFTVPRDVRSANRGRDAPAGRDSGSGFRLAQDL